MSPLLALLSLTAVASPDVAVQTAHSVAPVPVVEDVDPGLDLALERYTTTPWRLTARQYVRSEARVRSKPIGLVLKDSIVEVMAEVDGADRSCSTGWVQLIGGGFVCTRWAEQDEPDAVPVPLPTLVQFDHPDPDEYFTYLETGEYQRDELTEDEALVPFIYGKAWRRWDAPTWSSLWAWEHGRGPVGGLGTDRKFAFKGAIETERGPVFRRTDGAVVPVDEVFLYPITRFHGRELALYPLVDGHTPGWVTAYDGIVLRSLPDDEASPVGELAFQDPIDAVPVADNPDWLRIRGDVGDGAPRYMRADQAATWTPAPRAPDVTDNELWIDLELLEQVLTVMRGDQPIFLTLVSTGRQDKHRGTPTGLYRTYDKAAWGDMTSRDGADDVYHVEKVPWIMHFWPRYALHGTFWHWGMGHQASHGCVNLAPRDASWIFKHIGPGLPDGWHTVYATDDNPGTTMRIRKGLDLDLRDRRRLPGSDQASR